ncbi:MAG: hypothetical protein HFG04_08900 [Oscillibacter sp.]|nr:hypothetical protein [Oscillibacter sp.]
MLRLAKNIRQPESYERNPSGVSLVFNQKFSGLRRRPENLLRLAKNIRQPESYERNPSEVSLVFNQKFSGLRRRPENLLRLAKNIRQPESYERNPSEVSLVFYPKNIQYLSGTQRGPFLFNKEVSTLQGESASPDSQKSFLCPVARRDIF